MTFILDLSPGDIKLRLIDLGSLVEYEEYDYLNILHASLADFLFDESRSQELYIDPQLIHTKIAQAFLREDLKPDTGKPFICCQLLCHTKTYYQTSLGFIDMIIYNTTVLTQN